MFYKSLTYSGVFEIRKEPKTDNYYLEQKFFNYKTPSKFYGDMQSYVDFYWKSFVNSGYVGGVILTGQAGSGKSMISAALCNLAINRGMQVVEVTNIQFTPSLLRFLDDLNNVVLFFDEFGKNFQVTQQDKMLTLLSNISGKERIILITENNKHRISEFIRNRPGRVKYSLHFNKLPLKAVKEYCKEFEVDEEFYKDFLDAYKTMVTFQFDHLIAIVQEHKVNPDMEFDTLIELLNIDGMSGVKTIIPTSVTQISTGKDAKISNCNPETMPIDNLEANGMFYINVEIPIEQTPEEKIANPYASGERFNLMVGKGDIINMSDELLIFNTKGMEIMCKIERK